MDEIFESNVEFYKRGFFDCITYKDPYQDCTVRLHKKQIQALELFNDDVTTFVGYGGAARGGKSLLLTLAPLLECFAYEGSRYLIGRKNLTMLKQTTLKTLLRVMKTFEIKEGIDYRIDKTINEIVFKNGSEIIFKNLEYKPSDTDTTSFGSLEITKALIDQSEHVNLKVVNKVAERVGSHANLKYGLKGKLLEAFNPSAGHVKTRYWLPFRDDKEKRTKKFVRALPSDNPSPEAQQWVKEKIAEFEDGTMDKVDYQKQILGDFDYDNDPQRLITDDAIHDLWTNRHAARGKRYISADIAARGSDKYRVVIWDGFRMIHKFSMDKSGGKDILDSIEELMKRFKVRQSLVTYDSDGVGFFIGDEGGFLPQAKPFVNNSTPIVQKESPRIQNNGKKKKVENYKNLKSQCYFMYAKMVMNGKILIDFDCSDDEKQEIIDEHQVIKKKDNRSDKLEIIGKKELKEVLGRSPDWTDAMMMRMYFELVKPSFEFSVA